ncbi:MAG: M81 family metallopeptidase, partial [Anaerolineaceae bacterium]
NTFSPIPTTYASFSQRAGALTGILETDELQELIRLYGDQHLNIASLGFISVMRQYFHEVYPILLTAAEPSGMIPAEVFDHIAEKIAQGIRQNGPFDGVFLDLHGAMVFGDFQDGEEELVRRVRQAAGNIPIVTSFDLHGNITSGCFDLADGMVGCRTYPHVDMNETGMRCAYLMQHMLSGEPIFKAFQAVPFLWPVSTQSTFIEPCKSLYSLIDTVEKRPGVLSATLMAGFQSADVEHQGPTVFAYGISQKAADDAVAYLYSAVMTREHDFRSDLPDAAEAVRAAAAHWGKTRKPVILADTYDNPGGGGTSDTVGMLGTLLETQAQDAAVGMIYDPDITELAHRAGEGAVIEAGVGGKLMPGQQPCFATWTVERLHSGAFSGSSPVNAGLALDMGKMAQLRCGGVRVVISSVRTQANDRQMFKVVGVNPEDMRVVAVKSANHFRADFESIAGDIFTFKSHGAAVENPEMAAYQNLRKGVRLQGMGRVNE